MKFKKSFIKDDKVINAGKPMLAKTSGAEAMRVWLVDGKEDYRQLQADLLNVEGNIFCSKTFSTASRMMIALKYETAPDVVLLNLKMTEMHGIEVIWRLLKLAPMTRIVIQGDFYGKALLGGVRIEEVPESLVKRISGREIVKSLQVLRNDVPMRYFKKSLLPPDSSTGRRIKTNHNHDPEKEEKKRNI